MAGNARFLRNTATQAWLSQFDPLEQPTAQVMLEAMLLVSRDAFAERLQALVHKRVGAEPGCVGLYVEREWPSRNGVPYRMFKQTKRPPRRASGKGPDPIKPTIPYDLEVGSEGIVAQLLTEICRASNGRAIMQPGPNAIRRKHIRRFILVTDFIGSGKRGWQYLQAAWRVASVRSWWSRRATKGMAFEVVTYSGTISGIQRIRSHPSAPLVSQVAGCPTVESCFDYGTRQDVRQLCERRNPDKSFPALGFGQTGALIAFAHGAPNNCPAFLFKKAGGWAPLFPARVTETARATFAVDSAMEEVKARLIKMGQIRLADPGLKAVVASRRALLVVMAALSKPPRTVEAVSRKTQLTLFEVETEIARGMKLGWLDAQNHVADAGHAELARVRAAPHEGGVVPQVTETPYYPKSLRAPK
ncbi:phosphoribosyltransferase-like protein [Metallibacterium scheffleri]